MTRNAFAATVAVLCLVVLSAVSGCRHGGSATAPPANARVGSSNQTIRVGGLARTFRLYRPTTLPADAPLVVMLHGGFGSGAQAEKAYGWDVEAEREHFLVVYPDGVNHAWNTGGGCCGTPAKQNIDDVAFIKAVVATVESEAPVDPDRIYATGISNGGIMAYRLACDTGLFAAIGPDSATLLGSCPSPQPVSVLHIHGTADTRIPYGGGEGEGVAHIDGPPVEQVVATWRGTDACGTPTATESGPLTTTTAQCPDGRAVELIAITGAGHQWPGSQRHPAEEAVLGVDPPSSALNATETYWKFFAAHPRNQA